MTILKGIPRILPPKLLYAMAKMGHNDLMVLADANFPAESIAQAANAELIRMDASTVPEVLEAVLKLLPLDTYTEFPAGVMAVLPSDAGVIETPVWDDFQRILNFYEGRPVGMEKIEQQAFYDRAKTAMVVVATGESALYGNLIIRKGVLGPEEPASAVRSQLTA
jgi:L-fucose mutarotase